tara:strand:- start:4892 stop:5944 length:1053 start_codon:yes stop_codon:yes gene_type:complete
MNVVDRISKLDPYIPSNRDFDSKNWSYCDWNESQFSPSPLVISSIEDFLLNGNIEKYPCTNNKELLELLSDYTGLQTENITVYNGSDDALKDIFLSFADQQTKIVTYCPSYTQVDTFIAMSTNIHQKHPIKDPLGDHEYDFEVLKNYDIAYLANPNNPTGHIIEKDVIEQIISSNPNTIFIIDEAYYEFSQVSCSDLVLKYDNIIITRTFSKAFGLASLRIGYALGPKEKISFLNKIKNVKSINSIAQVAAIACLKDLNYLNKCVAETKQSRKLLEDYIDKSEHLSCAKSHSNFVLVKTNSSERVIKKMIENKISIRDRSSFKNLNNCIRITVGSLETTKRIIEVLESTK